MMGLLLALGGIAVLIQIRIAGKGNTAVLAQAIVAQQTGNEGRRKTLYEQMELIMAFAQGTVTTAYEGGQGAARYQTARNALTSP